MTSAKFAIFDHLAALGRALGSPQRLELLEHAAQGERPVEALAALAGLSVANASHHLKQLKHAGLVQARRSGKQVLYRLVAGPPERLLAALRAQGEHAHAEVRQIIKDSFLRLDSLEPVTRADLLHRLEADDVVLLDVRPGDEFALGHVPGAINIPLAELERRLADLPVEREIVAYCRGPYCILAFEAVAALRTRGYRARRLEDGYPEWKAAGMAVHTAAGRPTEARTRPP